MIGTIEPSQAEEEIFPDGILKPPQAEERLILLGFDPRTSCKPQQEECSFTTYNRWTKVYNYCELTLLLRGEGRRPEL